MKRAHDPERWADQQRNRRNPAEIRAYNGWLEAREAGFAEAAKVLKIQHMMAMNVGADKVPEVSSIWNGPQVRVKIAIRMPAYHAAVWTPDGGYELVSLDAHPDIANLFPPSWEEITRVTRRAILPDVFVQLYEVHPTIAGAV